MYSEDIPASPKLADKYELHDGSSATTVQAEKE